MQVLIPHQAFAQIIVTATVGAVLMLSSATPALYKDGDEYLDTEAEYWWLHNIQRLIRHRPRHILYIQERKYVLSWIALRAILIVWSHDDADTRIWYIAQILLLLPVLTYIQGLDKTRHRPTAGTETIRWGTISAFAAVALMYTGGAVVPWGISTIILAIPVYCVLDACIPAVHYNSGPEGRPTVYTNAFAATIALACIAVSLAWNHQQADGPITSTASDSMPPVEHSSKCTRDLNMQVCGAQPPVPSIVKDNSGCCCWAGEIPGGYYVPDGNGGCVPKTCMARISTGKGERDCCTHLITAETLPLLAGKYRCVCGNTMANPRMNNAIDGKCVCAPGYSGTYCTVKS